MAIYFHVGVELVPAPGRENTIISPGGVLAPLLKVRSHVSLFLDRLFHWFIYA